MSNSPRYVGFIDPPYNVTLTDDSGTALNLTGCTSNSFSLTMLNENTGLTKAGVGTWTTPADNTGKASYQWALADVNTAGPWLIYTTVKLPAESAPREFDPELILFLSGTVGAGAAPPGVLPAPVASPLVINVRDYGALGDGTDQTTQIANARAAANNAGGGTVWWPEGVYVTGNQTLYSNVYDVGAGIGVTIIKLKNGANTDLFSGFTGNINLSGVLPNGPTTGVFFWGFRDITLDGNKANQSSGTSYCIRAYGNGHLLEHVEVRNGYSGNILIDWYGPVDRTGTNDAPMPRWFDVMSHDCNGIGIQVGGPTDMEWIGVNGFATGSHVLHVCPNATALRMTNCHLWATPVSVSALTMLCEASSLAMANCQIEGSDFVTLGLLGSDNQLSGCEIGIATDATRDGVGIQLGQNSGGTPFPGQILQGSGATLAAASNTNLIIGKMFNCDDGAIKEVNTGNNTFMLSVYQTVGTAIGSNSGYPLSSDNGQIIVHGLTSDGSPGKGGFFQIGNGSFYGMQVYANDGSVLFSLDTFDKVFQLKNGNAFSGYSDNGSTLKYSLNASDGSFLLGNASTLRSGSGAPASNLGNVGDYYFRLDTPSTANQRLYVKTGTSTWVGIV